MTFYCIESYKTFLVWYIGKTFCQPVNKQLNPHYLFPGSNNERINAKDLKNLNTSLCFKQR